MAGQARTIKAQLVVALSFDLSPAVKSGAFFIVWPYIFSKALLALLLALLVVPCA